MNGIQAMAEQGIVGRSILLDFHSWRLEQGIEYDPFKTGSIPLKYLIAVAEAQGTETRFGDILIIRSGISPLSPGVGTFPTITHNSPPGPRHLC